MLDAGLIRIGVALVTSSARSFSSVAEVVAHSPAAIFLSVTLNRFDWSASTNSNNSEAVLFLSATPVITHQGYARFAF